MKRFFFSAIALVVTATACTESGLLETPDSYANPIVFDTYIGKAPITKAENIDVNYLKGYVVNEDGERVASDDIPDGVHVLAFKSPTGTLNPDNVDFDSAYLDGRLIWSTSHWTYQIYANNQWETDDPYMPTGTDLAVVAYNLAAEDALSISTDGRRLDFRVPNTVSDQVDLLVTPLTFVSEQSNSDTSVPLHFYHLLSRVGFKVLSVGGSSTSIVISGIKLHGLFVKTGYIDLTFATATPSSSTINSVNGRKPSIVSVSDGADSKVDTYSFFDLGESFHITGDRCNEGTGAQIYANQKKGDVSYEANSNNCYMMIMPGMVGSLPDTQDIDDDGDTTEEVIPYIEVEYALASGPSTTAIVPLTQTIDGQEKNWTFEAGKAYEFIFKIATATIEFSATVVEGSDWATPIQREI